MKNNTAIPAITRLTIIINNEIVFISDCPSKIMLKKNTKNTPRNCPPNRRIPPAVAYPTGKVVCMAKELAVDRRG